MGLRSFLNNVWRIFKNFHSKVWNSVVGIIEDIRKEIMIRKAQKEVEKQLNEFKESFDALLNKYYDFLPLPQGKSIIENTTKSGKKVYVVVFNDSRSKNVRTVEVYSDTGFFALPPHYQILQKISLHSFIEKVKENVFKSIHENKGFDK